MASSCRHSREKIRDFNFFFSFIFFLFGKMRTDCIVAFVATLLAERAAAWNGVVPPTSMTAQWQYNDPQSVAPDGPPLGTSFSGILCDGAVLQRGESVSAVVYGQVLGGVEASASVSVTVAEVDAASYTVAATIVDLHTVGGNLTWRAQLKPHPDYGGSITITAKCQGCRSLSLSLSKPRFVVRTPTPPHPPIPSLNLSKNCLDCHSSPPRRA